MIDQINELPEDGLSLHPKGRYIANTWISRKSLNKLYFSYTLLKLELFKMQEFARKKKLGPKMPGAEIWKHYCYIWNQLPGICQNFKIRAKQNNFKFGIKNVSFEIFWTKSWKNYCNIWNQHPQVCQNAKTHMKLKIQIWGRNSLIWIFFGW